MGVCKRARNLPTAHPKRHRESLLFGAVTRKARRRAAESFEFSLLRFVRPGRAFLEGREAFQLLHHQVEALLGVGVQDGFLGGPGRGGGNRRRGPGRGPANDSATTTRRSPPAPGPPRPAPTSAARRASSRAHRPGPPRDPPPPETALPAAPGARNTARLPARGSRGRGGPTRNRRGPAAHRAAGKEETRGTWRMRPNKESRPGISTPQPAPSCARRASLCGRARRLTPRGAGVWSHPPTDPGAARFPLGRALDRSFSFPPLS